jgi:hypothetical protein
MKYFFLALLIAIGGEGTLYAQSANHPVDPQQIERNVTFTSPEVASLGKFAMQPPNYSNGSPQQTIPVFAIKENGIDYPIDLNYSYSGFQPTQSATNVGLGWVMTEGVITRMVKGLPDDNLSQYRKFETFNYLNLISSWEFGQGTPDQNAIIANGGTTPTFDLTANRIYNKLYDGQPDVYVFNFNGHSGRFLFLNDTAYVYPYGDFHITRSGSDFVIATPDGMEYTFGAADWTMTWHYNADQNTMTPDYYSLECNNSNGFLTFEGGITTTAWRIKKAVNKTTHAAMNFSYGSYTVSQEKRELSSFTFWSDPLITTSAYSHSLFENVINPSPTQTQSVYYYLTGIGSDHDSVVINTQGRNDFDPASQAKAISQIDVYSKSNMSSPVKTVKLNHSYFSDGTTAWNYQWLKLTGVVVAGGGESKEYDFTYNELGEAGYPNLSQNTYGLDHWGYYNGINNQYLVPQSDVTNIIIANGGFPNYIVQNTPWANRNPDFNYAKLFSLTQVKYPTGGYSNIVYESAGGRGIRVRSVEDNDGVNSYKKFFTYYPDNPIPAPPYSYSVYNMDAVVNACTPGPGYAQRYLTVTGSPKSSLDFFDDNSNFYSQVTEYIGSTDGQGGRNVYNYIRDEYASYTPLLTETDHYKFGSGSPVKKTVNTYTPKYIRNIQYWSDPTMNALGNCMTCYYSVDYTVSWTYYSPYDTPPGYPYGYLLSNASVAPYSFSTTWFQLTQTDDYNYADDGASTDNITKLYYNTIDPVTAFPKSVAPIRTDHVLSNGKTRSVQHFYPGDTDPDNPGNILGLPQMWDKTDAHYKYYTEPVLKSKSYVNTTLQSYDLNNFAYNSATDQLLLSSTESHPTGNANKLTWNYAYDSKANLIASSMQNDVITSYIWDYNNGLPIAKCENADAGSIAYTSFEADGTGSWSLGSTLRTLAPGVTGSSYYALNSDISRSGMNSGLTYIVSYWTQNGSSYTVPGTVTGYPLKGKTVTIDNVSWTYYEHKVSGQSTISINGSGYIDEVRLYPSSARMTTYTYRPLVGITSQCDLDNRVTYFEYDVFGRLARTRDMDKNIMKQYDYQYLVPGSAYYNVPQSGTFTKNNCSAGLGSSVTYFVPSNLYGSRLSQQDADQQAQNDVNANGQAYANANGFCYFSSAPKSGTFTKAGCNPSGTATVTYNVPAGTYTSLLNQGDADQQAQNDVNANGQNYADTHAACSWTNVAKSVTLTRNNCGSGSVGGAVTYDVPAGKYSSLISQADADQQAQNEVNANAQNYTNTHGTCTAMTTVTYQNYSSGGAPTVAFTNVNTGDQYYFAMFAGSTILGSIPSGVYNVTITASASQNVGFGCGQDGVGPTATFYNVDINICSDLYAVDNGN